MAYYLSTTLEADNISEVRTQVALALQSEGFGILTEIDIQATMKKKLDKDYLPYLILGACHPQSADKALSAEPHMGVFLPCNVIIRDLGHHQFEVAAVDPVAAMSPAGKPEIEPMAGEIREKLQFVLDQL